MLVGVNLCWGLPNDWIHIAFGEFSVMRHHPQDVSFSRKKSFPHGIILRLKFHSPGDSIRDLFIPDHWRSRRTFEFGSRFQSQKGHQQNCHEWPLFDGSLKILVQFQSSEAKRWVHEVFFSLIGPNWISRCWEAP